MNITDKVVDRIVDKCRAKIEKVIRTEIRAFFKTQFGDDGQFDGGRQRITETRKKNLMPLLVERLREGPSTSKQLVEDLGCSRSHLHNMVWRLRHKLAAQGETIVSDQFKDNGTVIYAIREL